MSPQGDEGQNPAPRLLFLQQFIFPLAKALKECFAVDGFHPATLQVIIAAVEHFARLCKLVEISGNNILNQFTRGASGFGCQFVEFGLQVGGEVYFHGFRVSESFHSGKCCHCSPTLPLAASSISPKMSNCLTLPAERSCPRLPARPRTPRTTC